MTSNRKRAFNLHAEPWRGQGDTMPGQAVTLYRRHDTPTLPILNAVNALWKSIQHNHPGTPNVSIVLQSSDYTHGHFAPGSWVTADGESMHELMLSTVSMALATNEGQVVKTVSTLLHEAAHAYAYANGIKDTSRQGRYHNGKFAELAHVFGCEVESHPQIGHTTPGITAAARLRYADEIANLMAAIRVYRRSAGLDLAAVLGGLGVSGVSGPLPRKPRAAYRSQSLTVICECDSPGWRISADLWDRSDMRCTICDSFYVEKRG